VARPTSSRLLRCRIYICLRRKRVVPDRSREPRAMTGLRFHALATQRTFGRLGRLLRRSRRSSATLAAAVVELSNRNIILAILLQQIEVCPVYHCPEGTIHVINSSIRMNDVPCWPCHILLHCDSEKFASRKSAKSRRSVVFANEMRNKGIPQTEAFHARSQRRSNRNHFGYIPMQGHTWKHKYVQDFNKAPLCRTFLWIPFGVSWVHRRSACSFE
jgi:hypothetical protein